MNRRRPGGSILCRRPSDLQLNCNDRAAREQEAARARGSLMRLAAIKSPSSLLLGADKMTTTILLVAVVGGLHAEGFFLAEADGVETISGNPQGDQVLFHRSGAAIAEGEVVFCRATL